MSKNQTQTSHPHRTEYSPATVSHTGLPCKNNVFKRKTRRWLAGWCMGAGIALVALLAFAGCDRSPTSTPAPTASPPPPATPVITPTIAPVRTETPKPAPTVPPTTAPPVSTPTARPTSSPPGEAPIPRATPTQAPASPTPQVTATQLPATPSPEAKPTQAPVTVTPQAKVTTPPTTSTPPVAVPAQTAGADVVKKGEDIFQKTAGGIGCAVCHGPDAYGNSAGNIRGATAEEVTKALRTQPSMGFIKLTDEDIQAVAAYLKLLESK